MLPALFTIEGRPPKGRKAASFINVGVHTVRNAMGKIPFVTKITN
jgi:hypothetical protein